MKRKWKVGDEVTCADKYVKTYDNGHITRIVDAGNKYPNLVIQWHKWGRTHADQLEDYSFPDAEGNYSYAGKPLELVKAAVEPEPSPRKSYNVLWHDHMCEPREAPKVVASFATKSEAEDYVKMQCIEYLQNYWGLTPALCGWHPLVAKTWSDLGYASVELEYRKRQLDLGVYTVEPVRPNFNLVIFAQKHTEKRGFNTLSELKAYLGTGSLWFEFHRLYDIPPVRTTPLNEIRSRSLPVVYMEAYGIKVTVEKVYR